VPSGKQDLKELSKVVCTGANSLLSFNFSIFQKFRTTVHIEVKKKFCLECSTTVTNKRGTSAVTDFFFHMHKFKLKTGQQFISALLSPQPVILFSSHGLFSSNPIYYSLG